LHNAVLRYNANQTMQLNVGCIVNDTNVSLTRTLLPISEHLNFSDQPKVTSVLQFEPIVALLLYCSYQQSSVLHRRMRFNGVL